MPLSFILDAPTGIPRGQIQIAKLGDFTDPRYGDFSFTADDVDAWKSNLAKLPGGRAPIDLDHSPEKKGETEAAGWITDIQLGADGTPQATVEWTSLGDKAIRDKRYLFFSPTITDHFTDEAGTDHGQALIGGGLTNRPFLNMPTVCLSRQLSITVEPEPEDTERYTLDYDTEEREAGAKEGWALPDGRFPIKTAGDVEKAVKLVGAYKGKYDAKAHVIKRAKAIGATSALPDSWSSDSRRSMDFTAENLKTLGIEDDAEQKKILDLQSAEKPDEAKILEAVKAALTPEPEKEKEPAKTLDQLAAEKGVKVLSNDEYTELKHGAEQGAAALKELQGEKFTRTFDQAAREGKVAAGQREVYEELYGSNPEKTLKLLEDAKPILKVTPQGSGAGDTPADPNQAAESQLNQSVKELMKSDKLDYPTALDRIMNGPVLA